MRITMKKLETLAKDFQYYLPGRRFGIQGYGIPSNYCLVEYTGEGGSYTCVTSWLPAGQLWEVIKGMRTAAYIFRSEMDDRCAGCGDRASLGGVE